MAVLSSSDEYDLACANLLYRELNQWGYQQNQAAHALNRIAYYLDGRTDTFDTANLTDTSIYQGNVVTNWSFDLSGAMREGGMLLLSMHWYPAPGQDAPAGPEGFPIARRRDGLCVVVADGEDVPQLSMVTVDGELALLRVGDGLVDCNRLAWASRIADGLPAQAVSAHRTLSTLLGDGADGIDVEAGVCHLMGFDPATYALVEELASTYQESNLEERRVL